MRLVAATAASVALEIHDRAALARALGAAVPSAWPPELVSDALTWFHGQLSASPANVGWFTWYAIALRDVDAPTLVASPGFKGGPEEGKVEIGYSVMPAYQRKGFATEMVAALTDWALSQPRVRAVFADVDPENTPSIRLLTNLGFVNVGEGDEPGYVRVERVK